MSLLNLLQDVSGNQLMDISSLNSLTHLLTLKADRNALHSAKLDEVGIVFQNYEDLCSYVNDSDWLLFTCIHFCSYVFGFGFFAM